MPVMKRLALTSWLGLWLGLISLGIIVFSVGSPAQTPELSNRAYSTALITLGPAAGAGTTNSADQFNPYGRGAALIIDITAKTGTTDIVVEIQGKDVVSGKYYAICTSASLNAVATTTLSTYPGQATTANVACSAALPAQWRVQVRSGAGTTPSFTLTVGANVQI